MRRAEKLLALCLLACGLVACQTAVPVNGDAEKHLPARFVQVARINAADAERARKELSHWGIPTSLQAPRAGECRLMVHPGFRWRAMAALRQLESHSPASGLGIRYD